MLQESLDAWKLCLELKHLIHRPNDEQKNQTVKIQQLYIMSDRKEADRSVKSRTLYFSLHHLSKAYLQNTECTEHEQQKSCKTTYYKANLLLSGNCGLQYSFEKVL